MHIHTTFRGIIASKEVPCSGCITLDVVFITPDNYRSERLLFDVVLSVEDTMPSWDVRHSHDFKWYHNMDT